MNYLLLFSILFLFNSTHAQYSSVKDEPFWQEFHEAYPVGNSAEENEVRSIAIDKQSNVWIATAAGIYKKEPGNAAWSSPFKISEKGPAYSVATGNDSTVWMGTWDGVYTFQNNTLKKITGTEGPVSSLCNSKEGMYALGPKGVWLFRQNVFEKKAYPIARSVRNAISDEKGGIWVATDVGLYHCNSQRTKHFFKTDVLLSAAVKDIALDKTNQVWVSGLGGVTILNNEIKKRVIRPQEGCPSIYATAVERSEDGTMWIGTQVGIVRITKDGKNSLRFTRRWLLDDHVNDIAFDKNDNAWIATMKGVSAIKKTKMTLAGKESYFYDVLMKRHIREPWISGQCHLTIPGDINSWQPEDDDNDGEYTANYLAQESFRYAATKSEDAKQKAKKAFDFLKKLKEVTGRPGFFARTIVPPEWAGRVHDPNRTFTGHQLAEELVKEPRFKPVESRWRLSADGKWLWKGDASSDEWCGHMMGYYFYHELVADKAEKKVIADHVASLVDHLILNNFNMVDIDGKHTRWSVWSPEILNHDPEWSPDRSQNSMELLTFLKLAYHVTGNMKYQQHYLKLIKEDHYLENMSQVKRQNPAWFIYFDVILQAYLYPILLHCETDPALLSFYRKHMDQWMNTRKKDNNPLINFLYCYSRDKKVEREASIDMLTDTPLDLINWTVDHTKREDIKIVHDPVLDELQVSELPPASIRTTIRWDKNPWSAVNGYPDTEREPVFWLLPYWMGRYLKMIPE
jgi:ligand-binding sensor domain-containing protein